MKKALKWIAYGTAALIAIAIFFNVEESTRWILAAGGFAYYVYIEIYKDVQRSREQATARLDRIERKLQEFENHPLNTMYIANGIEGLVDEYRDRKRALDRDPHEP